MIHQPLSPDLGSSQNQFVPEIVSPLLCSSGLVRHVLVFFFLKKSFLSLAPLTNTTAAFSAL